MAEPVSYGKAFRLVPNKAVDSNTPKDNIARHVFGDVPTPIPNPLSAALDFILTVVESSGPTSGTINFHEGGQLVILLYPGNPNALS